MNLVKLMLVSSVAATCLTVYLSAAPPTSPGSPPGSGPRKVSPIFKKGGDFAPKARPFRLGNGYTHVHPHPSATGANLKFQKNIAAELAKFDPRPADRLARFGHLVGEKAVCTGWHAKILAITPGNPGWLVKVRVTPYLVTASGSLALPTDCVDETYRYSGGKFQYLGGEVPADVIPGGLETF